jgi:hypothetical protein
MLQTFLEGTKGNKYFETGENGQIKKRSKKPNPDTLKYLVCAWGGNKGTMRRLKQRCQDAAVSRGVSGLTGLIRISATKH